MPVLVLMAHWQMQMYNAFQNVLIQVPSHWSVMLAEMFILGRCEYLILKPSSADTNDVF